MTTNVKRIVLISALFGILFYVVFAPMAYAQRGYMAYGGECVGLFFPLFALVIADIFNW